MSSDPPDASFAAAVEDIRPHLTAVKKWFSSVDLLPSASQLDDDALMTLFHDGDRTTVDTPEGQVTHIGVGGIVYAYGQSWTTSGTGSGSWYQPVTFETVPVTALDYPVVVNVGGLNRAVESDAELLQAAADLNGGVAPNAGPLIESGQLSIGWDPASTPVDSLPDLNAMRLVTGPVRSIRHFDITTPGGFVSSKKGFCPPPAPHGVGNTSPNFGRLTGPLVTAGRTFLYGKNGPIANVTSSNRESVYWFGPFEVRAGSPLLQFTAVVSSDFSDFGENARRGLSVITSGNTRVDVQGSTQAANTDCVLTSQTVTFVPFNVSSNETYTVTTLTPGAVGEEYWLSMSGLQGTVHSVAVEALNP